MGRNKHKSFTDTLPFVGGELTQIAEVPQVAEKLGFGLVSVGGLHMKLPPERCVHVCSCSRVYVCTCKGVCSHTMCMHLCAHMQGLMCRLLFLL